MIAVVQRVSRAELRIGGNVHCNIAGGLVILLGVAKDDSLQNADLLAEKVAMLRIFQDDNQKMNLSIRDVSGDALVVSQFTLCTDNTKSGNRPSFINAAPPDLAVPLYEHFILNMKNFLGSDKVKSGVFAAMMEVELVNDGPVTIILER